MANNLPTLARRVGRNIRRIVTFLALGGWTAGWGMVSLVGWTASSSPVMYAGLTMIATGLLGFGGATMWARRRLAARAEHSLIARAELEKLELADGMPARLHLFDDAWLTIHQALADPALPHADRSIEVIAQVTEAREQLIAMVRRQATLESELRQLSQYAATDLIRASRDEKVAEHAQIGRDAEALVRHTRTLATTADEVRALASRTGATTEKLKEAVAQFNLTLSAYREVEAELNKSLPAGQPAGQKRPLPQSQSS